MKPTPPIRRAADVVRSLVQQMIRLGLGGQDLLARVLVGRTLFTMPTRLQALEGRVQRIKAELKRLGELLPGVLSAQYNVCGTPGCRCKTTPPKKHGPYYQLSWSRKGKSATRFVRQTELRAVRGQTKAYQRLRQLIDDWIAASLEICEIKRQQDRQS